MDEKALRVLIERHPVEGSPEEMRRAFAALAEAGGAGDTSGIEPEETRLGGHRVLRLAPQNPLSPPILYCHGGGYVFGSPKTHLALGARLAIAASAEVLLLRYPLAPEARWPAQREAVLAACAAMKGPFLLGGDSAGGHLALAAALFGAGAKALLLFSPNTARDYAASATREKTGDAMNTHAQDDALAGMNFKDGPDGADPDQTLLLQELAKLPPLYLDAGTEEVLLDDTLRLARHAALAGADVSLRTRPGFHLIQLFAARYTPGTESLARAGEWVKALR